MDPAEAQKKRDIVEEEGLVIGGGTGVINRTKAEKGRNARPVGHRPTFRRQVSMMGKRECCNGWRVDLTNPPMKEKRKVIKPLLRLIGHLIGLVQSDKSTRIGVSSVLSLVVGCYMGLLGESRPSSDEEGRLVEKALHCLTPSN